MNHEEQMLVQYDKYISRCVRSYIRRSRTLSFLYEDMKAEAQLSFLSTIRKLGLKSAVKLESYQLYRVTKDMDRAMRKFVWNLYGAKNIYASIKCKAFPLSEYIVEGGDPDYVYSIFGAECDDYSFVNVEDILGNFTPKQRNIALLMMRGNTVSDIANMYHMSRATVYKLIHDMQNELKSAS